MFKTPPAFCILGFLHNLSFFFVIPAKAGVTIKGLFKKSDKERKQNNMDNFLTLGLPQPLLQALEEMKFSTPTPIQAKAIPPALEGRDILGSAQTGTGKTAAFAVPLLARLLNDKQSMALVMAPTRELAAQVLQTMQKILSRAPQIKTALLIGGDSMSKQLSQLRQRPRLIVGTPGRINDHLQQGTLKLDAVRFLVLDETDKMLDMGFEQQIDRIVKRIPQQRQTLLFSATLPSHIIGLANKYQKNPVRIAVGETHLPPPKITQEIVRLQQTEKYTTLLTQIRAREGSIIVFVKTKRGADRLAKKLNGEKMNAEAIHGNLSQNKRTRVIDAFRAKRCRILVATDVASRGLDIPHIEHVVNYDLPQVPEDYIHRIGRTARAGASGSAVCFITPEDGAMWRDIECILNPGAQPVRDPAHRPMQQQRQRRPEHGQQRSSKPFENRGFKKRRRGGRSSGRRPGNTARP